MLLQSLGYIYIYVCCYKHFGAECEWRIHASLKVKHNIWKIKKISRTYSYVSTVVCQVYNKLNLSFILDLIVDLVYEYSSISVKTLVKKVVSHFGYIVTYRKEWTKKQIALAQIYVVWEG